MTPNKQSSDAPWKAERTRAQVQWVELGGDPGFPGHFPEGLEPALRTVPCEITRKEPRHREVQHVHSRGQRCCRREADERHRTGSGSQCRTKVTGHCVENNNTHLPSPKQFCPTLKPFPFQRDNEIMPFKSTLHQQCLFSFMCWEHSFKEHFLKCNLAITWKKSQVKIFLWDSWKIWRCAISYVATKGN